MLEKDKVFTDLIPVRLLLHSKLSRAHLQAWYRGCSNKTESQKRRRRGGGVGGGWLWICRVKTAAGANVGSHSNCNLIIVYRISSCSGLKKMTRCSFWKAFPLGRLGNSADFHTSERRAAQNLSTRFAPREARTPSPEETREAAILPSLCSSQTAQNPATSSGFSPTSPPFLKDLLLHITSDWRVWFKV